MTSSILILLASQAFFAQSSTVQSPTREPPDGLGWHIARLDDVDGDKCEDFAVDDGEGNAWVVSGKDGHAIAHASGVPLAMTTLGGDVDGDGSWDIVVWKGFSISGSSADVGLALRSGKDLHEIRRCRLPEFYQHANGTAAGAGDWNGDGKPDFAFGAGGLLDFSGASGELLQELPAEDSGSAGTRLSIVDIDHDGNPDVCQSTDVGGWILGQTFTRMILQRPALQSAGARFTSTWHGSGQLLCVVPDIDGDGWSDLLVTCSERRAPQEPSVPRPGRRSLHDEFLIGATAISGATGKLLRNFSFSQVATQAADFVPTHVTAALLDDLDGDGVKDFAASCVQFLSGIVIVYSGKSGAVLRTHKEVPWLELPANRFVNCSFAISVFGLGDTNADGLADYAIGAAGKPENPAAGCFSIYSGKTGEMRFTVSKKTLEKK